MGDPATFMTSAPSFGSEKKVPTSWKPVQPASLAPSIEVGEPGSPVGSWSFHLLRSRLPPGAHFGSRADAAWKAAKRRTREDLRVKDIFGNWR